MATACHLLPSEGIPVCVQPDITLRESLERYQACWLIWDEHKQAFYEDRDLYFCQLVPVDECDFLKERILPSSDLHLRTAYPIFFSASEFAATLEYQCERTPKAGPMPIPYFIRIPGDGDGDDPVSTLEVTVPFAVIEQVAAREQRKAHLRGRRQARLYPSLLFLRASLVALQEQLQSACDQEQRSALSADIMHVRKVLALRDHWLSQHQYYTAVTTIDTSTCTLRVGLPAVLYAGEIEVCA